MTVERAQADAAFDLVVMVASLGGQRSAATVLTGLPGNFPVPIVVFQHGPRRPGAEPLTPLLQRRTDLSVGTAQSGDRLLGSGVTVIPRGCTALYDRDHGLQLKETRPGTGGNELLRSAAEVAGARLIVLVLTGMLSDGADGVRAVKRAGGRVLVEDPRTAQAAGMPSSAIATGCVDFVLPNTRLAAALVALTLAPGGAELFTVPTPAWASLGA